MESCVLFDPCEHDTFIIGTHGRYTFNDMASLLNFYGVFRFAFIGSLVANLLISSSASSTQADAGNGKSNNFELNSVRVIIHAKDSSTQSFHDLKRRLSSYDPSGKVIRVLKEVSDARIVSVEVGKGMALSELQSDLTDIASVELEAVANVDADQAVVQTVMESQPPQIATWGNIRIGVQEAHLITQGHGASVCIIDTGIDRKHPDLHANVIGAISTLGPMTPDRTYWDDHGHGTLMAGIIAAGDNQIGRVGVAPNSKIIAVKAFDHRGQAWVSDLIEAIHYCIKRKVDVINMSWSTSADVVSLKEALKEAASKGITLVGSSGNTGKSRVHFPAAYDFVIAVSAANHLDQFASFSNYGREIQFIAPGVTIYSTLPGGRYGTVSGTSPAAAFVSGTAALVKSIKFSQGSLVGEDIGLSSEKQGLGMIDAAASLFDHKGHKERHF